MDLSNEELLYTRLSKGLFDITHLRSLLVKYKDNPKIVKKVMQKIKEKENNESRIERK